MAHLDYVATFTVELVELVKLVKKNLSERLRMLTHSVSAC